MYSTVSPNVITVAKPEHNEQPDPNVQPGSSDPCKTYVCDIFQPNGNQLEERNWNETQLYENQSQIFQVDGN